MDNFYYPATRVTARVWAMKTNQLAPQIVLNQAALHRASRQQPAIMTLGSELAAASVEWHAPVYWVSVTNPATLLGTLLEHFHGIYHSPGGLLCSQLGDDHEFFLLPKPMEAWAPGRFEQLMARVLQMQLTGLSYPAIVAEIRQQAGNLSEQVAA